jgi:hypothetical protein
VSWGSKVCQGRCANPQQNDLYTKHECSSRVPYFALDSEGTCVQLESPSGSIRFHFPAGQLGKLPQLTDQKIEMLCFHLDLLVGHRFPKLSSVRQGTLKQHSCFCKYCMFMVLTSPFLDSRSRHCCSMSSPLLGHISPPCPGVSRRFFFSPSLSSLSPLVGSVLVGSVLVYTRSACIVSTYCFHTLLVISYSVAVLLCSSHEVICIHASHPQNQI